MRLSHRILVLSLCIAVSSSMLASQDTHTPKSDAKPLTNGDVVEMLKAGLSQEILIAKINASACEFDTSPAALKALKTSSVPDAVILAMVQAHGGPTAPEVQQTNSAEVSAPARVDCVTSSSDPVPVFSAPRTQQPINKVLRDRHRSIRYSYAQRVPAQDTILNWRIDEILD